MSNDTDAKEWVTIKVPKAVRDEAREDPRTYGEVMESGLDERPSPKAHVEPEVNIPPDVLAEALSESLDTDAPNFDDVKAACAAAIREELPVGEMGR